MTSLSALFADRCVPLDTPDAHLAWDHMPLLRFDRQEPFAPPVLGYSIHRTAVKSPSSKFLLDPAGGTLIEYAVWYDWDIAHLYDLEHVWVQLDADNRVQCVEASHHGEKRAMTLNGPLPAMQGRRAVLFAEPGKHAHWADAANMVAKAGRRIAEACGPKAGKEGIHLGNPFYNARTYRVTDIDIATARAKLSSDAFRPDFDFADPGGDARLRLLEWGALAQWIPARVTWLMQTLRPSVSGAT